jgi:hypothetical protein
MDIRRSDSFKSMGKKHTTPVNSLEADKARAALAALFGDAPPSSSSQPEGQTLDGTALANHKAAEANKVTAKIDALRRKREAREALLQAAAANGLTLDDLLDALEADGKAE